MSGHEKRPLVPRLRFPEFRDAGEWITVELGKLSRLLTERVGSTTCTPYTIISGVGLISQEEKLGRTIAGNSLKNYLVLQYNDFAYNKSATKAYPQGFIALYTGDERAAVPNSIFTCFRVNQNQAIPTFLDALFTSNLHGKWLRARIAVGARAHGSLQVSDDDLMATPVPLPNGTNSLEEQQKIADCLSSLDNLIAAEIQKLETLKTHKKGLMQQLFPREGETVPRLRFPEFQNAGEWEEVALGEIAEIKLGKMLDSKKHTSGNLLPYLNNLSVRWNDVDTSNLPKMYFDNDELDRFGLRAGDVVVCEGGEPGRSAVWDGRLPNLKFQKAIHRVRFNVPFEPHLLVFYLQSIADTPRFEMLFTGGGIKHLTGETFSRLKIPMASHAEQQHIANYLCSLEELITAQTQKIDALKTHKKGLMQQLFPTLDEVGA